MSILLTLADLFFIGSVSGWCLELVFRKFFSSANPKHKWINPGFCIGPYVPLYGFGLCILYLLASIGDLYGIAGSIWGKALLFLGMAVSMTLIEYIAGIMLLKGAKLRLWDYSKLWGNIDGLICPLFSFFWAVLGGVYYFVLHPHILGALSWLANNLAFSFFIGFFFGVFIVDMATCAHWVSRLKKFADENGVIVKYENLKAHIRHAQERASQKVYFLFAIRSDRAITEHLKKAHEAIEKIRHHRDKPAA